MRCQPIHSRNAAKWAIATQMMTQNRNERAVQAMPPSDESIA